MAVDDIAVRGQLDSGALGLAQQLARVQVGT